MPKRYYAVITVPDDWHGAAPRDTTAEAATWVEGMLLAGELGRRMDELGVTVYRTVADLYDDYSVNAGDFAKEADRLSEG